MARRDVEVDVATLLAGAGLGLTFATGGNLTAGPLPADDGLRVACRFTGGGDSADYLGSPDSLWMADVQVLVRGNRDAYRATKALADGCFDALHLPALAGYVRVKSEGAGPNYLGPDAQGRHVFSFTAALEYVG